MRLLRAACSTFVDGASLAQRAQCRLRSHAFELNGDEQLRSPLHRASPLQTNANNQNTTTLETAAATTATRTVCDQDRIGSVRRD